jgi:hypothetical protein
MKVYGDIESVNLATGERFQRVSGDGESRLVSTGIPVSERSYDPKSTVVVPPRRPYESDEDFFRRIVMINDLL